MHRGSSCVVQQLSILCRGRGHPYKIMFGHCDNNSQKRVLSQRTATVWNSLLAIAVLLTQFGSEQVWKTLIHALLVSFDTRIVIVQGTLQRSMALCPLNWPIDLYHCFLLFYLSLSSASSLNMYVCIFEYTHRLNNKLF